MYGRKKKPNKNNQQQQQQQQGEEIKTEEVKPSQPEPTPGKRYNTFLLTEMF